MNPNRVDMTLERSAKQWSDLLHAVMRDDNNLLTVKEKDYYIDEINYKITGSRHSKIEILKDIELSMPDYSDII